MALPKVPHRRPPLERAVSGPGAGVQASQASPLPPAISSAPAPSLDIATTAWLGAIIRFLTNIIFFYTPSSVKETRRLHLVAAQRWERPTRIYRIILGLLRSLRVTLRQSLIPSNG